MKKRNPTIVILEDSSKVNFGGGQRVTLTIIKILKKFSENTILFDTTRKSYFYFSASEYSSNCYKLYSFGKIGSGFLSKFYKLIEFFLFPILLLLNTFIIYIKIRNFEEKILYATTKKSLLFAYCLNFCFDIPFIYHAHLIEKKSINSFILNKILKRSKIVIAVSNSVLKSIKNNHICIIPNPIENIVRSNPRKLKKQVIVGLFASLIKIKGVDYFIESYKYLKNNRDIYFWIYGEGVEKKALIKRANSNIIFKGFTHNTIEEMNNNIDILCFPSIVEESFGISIIEAFSCGIPVIATNIGGQAELVKNDNDGYLVPIKSPIEIAKKIDYLIDNPIIYSKISENVLKKSTNYFIDRFEKQIIDVFFKSL